jgi:hypothetical protein
MSQLSTARQALFQALVPLMAEGRVTAYPPESVTSPCIYIESPTGALAEVGGATLVRASFAVVAIADGAQRPQVLELDDLVSRIWDACRTVPTANPQSWNGGSVDIGGVMQRAVTINVEITILARTLCDAPMS